MRVDRFNVAVDDTGSIALVLPPEAVADGLNHHMELLSAVREFTMLTLLRPVDSRWEELSVRTGARCVVWFNVAGPREPRR